MKSLQETVRSAFKAAWNKMSLLHTRKDPAMFRDPLDGRTHDYLVKRFCWRLFWQHLKFKLGISKPLYVSQSEGALSIHLVALADGKRVRCVHSTESGCWKVVDFDSPVIPVTTEYRPIIQVFRPKMNGEKDKGREWDYVKDNIAEVRVPHEDPRSQALHVPIRQALSKPAQDRVDTHNLIKKIDELISALKEQEKQKPEVKEQETKHDRYDSEEEHPRSHLRYRSPHQPPLEGE